MFRKVLVANRGEIAVRVIRCLREMQIQSVALFSDPDRNAPHVRMADQAVHLPGSTGAETYMDMDKVFAAVKLTGAEAIHPGYGFLSERAEFAERCKKEGIVFIGPDADAIDRMGDKTSARSIMEAAGVPIVPGFQEEASVDEVLEKAKEMGFPVMLKAAAGGGGKGMRLVEREEQFKSAFDQARSEAAQAFGDDRVYLEKFVANPRHIEVQVVCDQHGNAIHLGERECTIQRRHQKVVEEAPSPVVDGKLREELGDIAIRAARAVNYHSVGTIEFLMDRDKKVYFLEMNTRLQVEHPVTEWITGLDLVRLQVEIAQGNPLPITQDEVSFTGHAIECRVYAEDPEHKFRPAPGLITELLTPSGPGVRDDSGVFQGFEVPMFYDPMISKLSTWAETREKATQRMLRALAEYKIAGIKHNLSFHRRLMRHPAFAAADFDTSFIDRHPELCDPQVSEERLESAIIAAAIKYFKVHHKPHDLHADNTSKVSGWKAYGRMQAVKGGRW